MWNAVEAAILARLRARLPPDVKVASEEDLQRMPELRQHAPAAWVIYDGYRVGDQIGPLRRQQQVLLEFYVVLAAKSAAGRGDTNAARDAVGDLSEQALQALLGFEVPGGKHLHLSDAPGPEYSAGYAYLPLAFTVAHTFKGDPS